MRRRSRCARDDGRPQHGMPCGRDGERSDRQTHEREADQHGRAPMNHVHMPLWLARWFGCRRIPCTANALDREHKRHPGSIMVIVDQQLFIWRRAEGL
jgi:hypothetical protein